MPRPGSVGRRAKPETDANAHERPPRNTQVPMGQHAAAPHEKEGAASGRLGVLVGAIVRGNRRPTRYTSRATKRRCYPSGCPVEALRRLTRRDPGLPRSIGPAEANTSVRTRGPPPRVAPLCDSLVTRRAALRLPRGHRSRPPRMIFSALPCRPRTVASESTAVGPHERLCSLGWTRCASGTVPVFRTRLRLRFGRGER